MPYLNLDVDFFGHRKTGRLKARIGPTADIYPLRLCGYVAKYFPITGTIIDESVAEIEHHMEWTGEPGVLFQALLDLNFIEMEGQSTHIHDWEEHQGHLAAFKLRAVSAAKSRWNKDFGCKYDNSNATSNACAQTSNATSNAKDDLKQCPNHTNHTNHTIPNQPTNPEAVGLVEFLVGKGLGKTKAVELATIPNLTTAHVQTIWEEIETKADIKSKPGYLAMKLIGCQWITIKKIDPRQVCKWCNAGMVTEIEGVKVPSAGVKQNASGINWEGGKIPSEKLTPENIKLTTGKAAQ